MKLVLGIASDWFYLGPGERGSSMMVSGGRNMVVLPWIMGAGYPCKEQGWPEQV